MEIFDSVDKFFSSINSYLTYNEIFIICAGLFIFTVLCVLITTSRSYESRLIKAVDMFNNYFLDSPQITEENLISFNNRMKSKKVPKQLRKEWQQFVLYREDKASKYMSFDNCVSVPLKNSSFARSITIMNIIAYILVIVSLILNAYCSYEGNISSVLQHILLCPILILLVNYIITIFLNFRHSAIISDLNQNYQYFETNIDKATQTLPEYVDYEVLFDKNEIKHGIPILYAYLEKRAEEEKKELERSRLKNIEHEKFNFDEAGIESSLVLDRAMQEAENYINERKKCMEDMGQINSDITQQEMAYRDITKEYQRQLQVSKETFQNFKQQLEEVDSSIEANYIKKQQQQELDRQRNLERDFDTATDRHKKIIESYQQELTAVENALKKAKSSLEKSMMSEFQTYSGKVYDAVTKVVEEREEEKTDKLKAEIKGLEEKIVAKDTELDNAYEQNRVLNEKLDSQHDTIEDLTSKKKRKKGAVVYEQAQQTYVPRQEYKQMEQPSYQEQRQPVEQYNQETAQIYPYQGQEQYNDEPENYYQDNQHADNNYEQPQYADQVESENINYSNENVEDFDYENDSQDYDSSSNQEINDENDYDYDEELNPDDEDIAQADQMDDENFDEGAEDENLYVDESQEEVSPSQTENEFYEDENPDDEDEGEEGEDGALTFDVESRENDEEDGVKSQDVFTVEENESKPVKKAGRPRKIVAQNTLNEPKKSRGRPKKIVEKKEEPSEPKRGRGRPKKITTIDSLNSEEQPKRGRGRPKKEQTTLTSPTDEKTNKASEKPKKKAGRPRKTEQAEVSRTEKIEETKKKQVKRGRPKKETVSEKDESKTESKPKRGRGRPKKILDTQSTEKQEKSQTQKKGRGRPKKSTNNAETSNVAGETQTELNEIQDIDEYLKQIDDEIAKENAKLEETQKELAKKARISRRRS